MIRNVTRFALILPFLAAAPALGQDANITMPTPAVEQHLQEVPFEVAQEQDTRFKGDRTQRAILVFADSVRLAVKWATAPFGGETFNNVPRYEVAAYRLQKLFLDPPDYVVPPTIVRAVPAPDPNEMGRTFHEAKSSLVVLQYWLWSVTAQDVYDKDRFEKDSVYARHLGDFNILTYLIRHSDQNLGNFLISTDSTNPRVFTVDNGVAFESDVSDRGFAWRNLRVKRLPARTVERLRAITPEDLQRTLAVMAEWRIQGDTLAPVAPGENIDPDKGTRHKDDVVQLGLTRREIDRLQDRLKDLLEKVDKGDVKVF